LAASSRSGSRQQFHFRVHGTRVSGISILVASRGPLGDVNSNSLSVNYTMYTLDNGDKFYSHSSTMGQADAAGKRTTAGVGQILGGTGKFAAMKGLVRSTGVSDGKANFNETQTEIEYWFAK